MTLMQQWQYLNLLETAFKISFPVKGIMNYRQIISNRLYISINQFYPSNELVHLSPGHF